MKEILEKLIPNKEDWNKTGIYKLYHVDNTDKLYIGSATQTKLYGKTKTRKGFYGRLYIHIWALKANKHHSPKLQKFINKHGIDGLRFEIIEICNVDESKEREEHYIKHFDSVKYGFNCTHDGYKNGAKLSLETRAKISKKVSDKLKGKIPKNWKDIKGTRAKPVLEYENNIVVKEYKSLTEMCKLNNFNYKHLSQVLTGKSKLPVYLRNTNKRWEYK